MASVRRLAERAPAPLSEDLPLFGAALPDDVPLHHQAVAAAAAARRTSPDAGYATSSKRIGTRGHAGPSVSSLRHVPRYWGTAPAPGGAHHVCPWRCREGCDCWGPVRSLRDRRAHSCGDRRHRRLLHDANLWGRLRRSSHPASRAVCSRSFSSRMAGTSWCLRLAVRRSGKWSQASGSSRPNHMTRSISAAPSSGKLVWLALRRACRSRTLTVLSRDHRGVHDRFAGTRVVRA